MSKSRNICQVKGCRNFGSYCRIHIGFVVPEVKEISKVSDNQKEILKEYRKRRSVFLKKHPECMASLDGCTKVATQIHHMGGKHSNELWLNDKLFLSVCHNCHQIIEKNPAFAKQHGLSVSRLSKELKNKRA